MLIELTQRQIGAAGTPVAVNTDLIARVEPVGDSGCTLHFNNGTRIDVLEPLDALMDRHDQTHDPEARQRAAKQRQQARRERDEARAKLIAENEAAAAQDHAARLAAESSRQQQQALAAAERAKAAARAAGLPERQVTSNVLPSGIDEKHPAPQPHQTAPAQPAPAPAAAPDADRQRQEADAKAAQHEADRGPGGAFKDKAAQGKAGNKK